MGNYEADIESTWQGMKEAGAPVDVIRPVNASFDPVEDDEVYTTGDLNGGISASAATLNLTNIANGPFSSKGIISIGSELIKYGTASGATLSDLTRGFKGTTPAVHADAEQVTRLYDNFGSYGVFTGFRSTDIDGHNIQVGDKKILIPGKNSTFDIDTESLIVYGSEEYQVIDAKITAPDMVSKILFTVHGR